MAFSHPPEPDLSLTLPQGFVIQSEAGCDVVTYIEVRNVGTNSLDHVELSADEPKGWTVYFRPTVADSLSRGGLRTVEVHVRPRRMRVQGNTR